MYTSFSEVNWSKWYVCHSCKHEETLLHDNEENREHWSWGRYKTQDSVKFSYHEKSEEHLRHYQKYRCDGCDVQCWSIQEYNKHCDTSTHKKLNKIVIECKMCDYKTYTKSSMDQHIGTQKHQDTMNGVEKQVYTCEPCGYSTRFKSQIEQHLLTKRHQTKSSKPIENYTCEVCDYSTEFKHHLDQHKKTQKHKNKTLGVNVEANLYCEKCDYTASSKALLEQHNKTKKHNKEIVNEEK